MRISTAWVLAALSLMQLGLAQSQYESYHTRVRDYDKRDYYAVQLEKRSPEEFARHFGLAYEGQIGELEGHHMFSSPKDGKRDVVAEKIEHFKARRRKRDIIPADEFELFESIRFTQKQNLKKLHKRIPPKYAERQVDESKMDDTDFKPSAIARQQRLMKSLDIRDPIFSAQWHLFNTREIGHDLNVTGLWLEGITGHNATVSIVDDGLDMFSDDLKDNYFAAGSYDFNDHVAEPRPRLPEDRHGTRCAGEVAAVRNDVCGVGVAYNAKVSGIRILSKLITDADEAVALNYGYHENQIYSCSWGPPDDGRAMDAPGILIQRAMVAGIQRGRRGLGSVFVFASGNGAGNGDNCNFDGYTNSIYSITVGAIDRKGLHPYYSEECSAQMVVTYSSGSGDAIHTTDVGVNQCVNRHGGTSAAAPLAAGVYALVLSVRPDLSWRDLQYLTVDTAVPVNEDDEDWVTVANGKKFNHKYGFGKLDAYTLVHAAKKHKPVKPQAWYHSPVHKSNAEIPTGKVGLTSTITVTKEDLLKNNFARLEQVTVTMNAVHGRRGDMSVDLVSPHGIVSHIATARPHDESPKGYRDWTFMTVKHWGEDPVGDWRVIIRDTNDNDKTGRLIDWKLSLWGESIDASKAKLHPLPGDPMPEEEQKSETTGAQSTTSLDGQTNPTVKPTPSDPTEKLTDRPVNSKPTITSGADATKPDAIKGSETDGSKLIPGFLPTFGVSSKSQLWIYAAVVVIFLFVSGLGIFLCIQRRKRTGGATGYKEVGDDYEFEDIEGETAGAMGKQTRKARDLYDAFGASDDEGDIFSDDGSVSEKPYRDAAEEDSEVEGSSDGSSSARNEKR